MTYLYKIFFLFSFLIYFNFAKAQGIINIKGFIEDIKIDTDRDVYINGEKIYYSVNYFINKKQNLPAISNVLYVELINCATNIPVSQKKIKIYDYATNDFIKIPDNISSGNYILRVYSQYQRNFSVYSYAYHLVTIFNPYNNQYPLIFDSEQDSIEIVSESNVLFRNLKNKIAIRLPNKLIGKQNKYYIKNDNNKFKKNISFTNDGFAQFDILIKDDKKYEFIVQTKDGDTISHNFPFINKEGIQTNIKRFKENVIYKINIRKADLKNKQYKISIFSPNYILKKTNQFEILNYEKTLIFSKELFSEGINYIVLFNNKGEIEKINSIYFSNTKIGKINIETKKTTFKTNENVEVLFSLNNIKNKQFSKALVSVGLKGLKKSNHNFTTDLYFASSVILKEYLQNADSNTIDAIMLLYDNRIDEYLFLKEIEKYSNPTLNHIPDIRDLTIRGALINEITKKPIVNQDVFLSVLFNNSQMHVAKTKKDGTFTFPLSNIKGINDVFVCKNILNNRQESELVINNLFSSRIPNFGVLPTFITDKNKELIKGIYYNSQINKDKNVRVLEHKREKNNIFNINYKDKETTYVENFIKLKNIEEFFFEVVPNVKYKKVGDKYTFAIYNNGNVLPGEPLVLLDKIPIFDFNKIKQLNISDIEKVEVINKRYFLGENEFYGIVMITTKTDDFAGIKFSNSGIFLEYHAIEQAKEKDAIINNTISSKDTPKFKTTLYWNPNLKFSKNKSNINFSTSYNKGSYIIKVKVYDSEGNCYIGNKEIVVE